MNKVIYNVSIKISELDENNVYITEYPIIQEKEDRYYVRKEDYYGIIYKEKNDYRICLNVAYNKNYMLTYESGVYSLNKETAFKIAYDEMKDFLDKKEKEIINFKNKLNSLKL